jgi:hypothetical protein
MIDASRHAPGTAYLAANRYQVDDRQPYVFKTQDYGKTWTKITTGIAEGHFARAVREDPVRKGLLFLATEHGVYVSFNDGEQWQPLQLNLPDAPVHDLVVKDQDVVLGTHGRGFWILDDIGPLRQYSPELKNAEAIFFQPADPIRKVYNAEFQYYLSTPADSLRIEVLDAAGKVIQTFAAKKTDKPAVSERGRPNPPSLNAGLNKFSWNLRYPGSTVFDGMIIWSARPQNGPVAPVGAYKVRFRCGAYTKEYDFNIRMNPNLEDVSEADLREQFDLALRIRDKVSAANEAVIRIRELKKELDEKIKKSDVAAQAGLKTLRDTLSAIEEDLYQVRNQSSQDPLNFPIKLNNRLASLQRSVETGDGRPTQGAYTVFEELSKELDGHLARLKSAVDGYEKR